MALDMSDLEYIAGKTGFSKNLDFFEPRGNPWGTPEELNEIRHGSIDREFWLDHNQRGAFRPEPVEPVKPVKPVKANPAKRHSCNREFERQRRLKAIYGEIEAEGRDPVIAPATTDNRTPIERVRVNAQAYATGNSSRDNYSAEDHAAYLAKERAEHARLYAQRAERQANA